MQAHSSLTSTQPLLEIKSLKKYFPIKRGLLLSRTVGHVKAVDDVSFYVRSGETLGLVGESGCGKTTTGRVILQVSNPTAGEIWFVDQEMGRINVGSPAVNVKLARKETRNENR